jgi:AP-2 complex subunit mu-1
MMDNGFPQITSLESLRRVVLSGKAAETKQVVKDTKVTDDITGKTDYRKAGIRHERNQVFLDVFEAVNLLLSSTGELLRSDCSGKIMMNTYLSGMPECQLGLNDQLMIKHQKAAAQKRGEKKRSKNRQSIVIDDIQFHRCVQLGQWDSERLISFIPPDGEFQLMKYRCTTVSLPFSLVPSLTETATTVTYSITIIGSFPSGYTATNVVVSIPTPDNTARCTITQPEPSMFQRNPNEKAKFNLQKKSIFWKINKFPGDGKFTLTAEVKRLTGIQQRAWSRPPISVDFQIGQWKPSGLKVEFLRVFEKGNYTPTNWVRYMAKAGQYQFRI